jgi:hypothetical protein
MSESFITEPERRTPVADDVDVAVVGGGTAGVVAALAAARAGATTALIERFGTVGGCPTVGRCVHLSNTFVDADLNKTITGIPLEIMKRLVEAGGTTSPTLAETLIGRLNIPNYILIDPEILAVVLLEMVEESAIHLMLHTYYCDPLLEGNALKGIIVQNKAGRRAVLAKNIVDASGEADVAHGAEAPCNTNPESPWFASTFGLLMRLGNVDTDRFLEYFLGLDAEAGGLDFSQWLSRHVGRPIDWLKDNRYWRRFLDPLPVGGVPKTHPGAGSYSKQTQRWFKERWEADGVFAYINMQLFRDAMRKAVEAGDFELLRKVEGFGEVGLNFDGVSGSRQRKGEVIFNAITPQNGFDAFNTEHITKVEIAARKRALELARFFQKFVPGFEDSYIVDTGVQTLPRHSRMIVGEHTLSKEDVKERRHFHDTVFLNVSEPTPGFAHEVPYRMMLPLDVENLLVTGKCAAGANHIRPIPGMMALGQAAGFAAALASQRDVTPRQLDIEALQERLVLHGVVLDPDRREKLG